MADRPLDRIHIEGLRAHCVIGANPDERHRKQPVVVNLVLEADLGEACRTDDLARTVNYRDVKLAVLDVVRGSSFVLLERLAEAVAEACLGFEFVHCVTVRIDKPGALRFARTVGVEIVRNR